MLYCCTELFQRSLKLDLVVARNMNLSPPGISQPAVNINFIVIGISTHVDVSQNGGTPQWMGVPSC